MEERLHKFLARAGVASRRSCEELIREGRVRVDGVVVREMGVKVDPEVAEIRLDDERVKPPPMVYYVAHKPRGVVSAVQDPEGRSTVVELLPKKARDKVFVVGRLDRESSGLIFMTNDGEVAQILTHPRYQVVKRYLLRAKEAPSPEQIEKLRRGIWLAEGKVPPIEMRLIEKDAHGAILEVDFAESTHRALRRALGKAGIQVRRLLRVAMGPLSLGSLASGECRALTPQELEAVRGIFEGRHLQPVKGSGRAELAAMRANLKSGLKARAKETAAIEKAAPKERKTRQGRASSRMQRAVEAKKSRIDARKAKKDKRRAARG